MDQSTSAEVKNEPISTDKETGPSAIFSWKTLVAAIAAFGTIGGIVLHVLGYVYHQAYLTTWNIDAGLFPKSIDDVAMLGYYALMDRSLYILLAIYENLLLLTFFATGLIGYAYVLLRFGNSDKQSKLAYMVRRVPERMRDLLVSTVAAIVAVAVFPVGLVVALFVMLVPAVAGEAVGKQVAKNQKEKFVAGCSSEYGKEKCIELRRDGKVVTRGFLIDSSTTHVAIFDVDERQPRVIERAGTEFFARSRVSGNSSTVR